MRRLSGRRRAALRPLSVRDVQAVLASLLPRASNYRAANYEELLKELQLFGVATKAQLRSVVLRHRREALQIDRSPLDTGNLQAFREEWGAANVKERLRTGTWFTWEGLIRIILELNFGEAYRTFADERDRT